MGEVRGKINKLTIKISFEYKIKNKKDFIIIDFDIINLKPVYILAKIPLDSPEKQSESLLRMCMILMLGGVPIGLMELFRTMTGAEYFDIIKKVGKQGEIVAVWMQNGLLKVLDNAVEGVRLWNLAESQYFM